MNKLVFALIVAIGQQVVANEHSELLQKCIDENRRLPSGHFKIDEPLRTAYNKSVSNIVGQGTPHLTDSRFWTGHGTYIEWVGEDKAEAMVYFESCDSEISHVTLDAAGKAKHCLLFHKRQNKSGTYAPGSNTSDRLYCLNAKVAGIAFGLTPGENHCDELVCRYYLTKNNPVGVLVRNSMSMLHRFEHVQSYMTKVDFRYEGGGYLSCQTITKLHGDVVLQIEEKRHSDGRATIGSGNRIFTVHEIKTDAQAGSVKLLDMRTPTKVNVHFDHVLLAKPSNALLTLQGPCAVTISGMDQPILSQSINALRSEKGIPYLVLDRCNTPDDLEDMFGRNNKLTLRRRDCFNGTAYRPVADASQTVRTRSQ